MSIPFNLTVGHSFVNTKRRNIDVYKSKYKVKGDSSTFSSSPDINQNLRLIVKVKLEDNIKTIYFKKTDNPALIAEKFCRKNKLDNKFVRPITAAMNKAISSLDDILFNNLDSNIEEIRELYRDMMEAGNVSSISDFSRDELEEDSLNRTI
jgi:hypothetical protein